MLSDLSAAVTMANVAIPDAIAFALLTGVYPIHGFNTLMVGMPVGSLFTSSQFMNLSLIAAMMMAVTDGMMGISSGSIVTALVTVTIMVG